MASSPRFTEAERERLRQLHAEGKSRNDIAREMNRSGGMITKAAAQLGLSFERGPEVAAATEARKADAKLLRAQLQFDLLGDAQRLRGQLFQPAKVFNFGGRDNTYEERTVDEPTFADKRNIMQACSTAVNTSLKIDEHDKVDETLSGIDAWLQHMTSGEDD